MTTLELPRHPSTGVAGNGLAMRTTPARKRSGSNLWLALVVGLLVLGGGAYAMRHMVIDRGAQARGFEKEKVEKRVLRITVTEDGNVESAANVDLKCRVEGGSQILWIIPDGSAVKKGTVLVKLGSAAIEEKITTQRILIERGRSTVFQAQEDMAVAEIAKREYLEGTFVKELQTADANIAVQEQNLKNAQNLFNHSEVMFRKGYINKLQLDTNKDAVERARIDIEAAKTSRRVLVDFTKAKMMKQLESAVDAARAKLEAEKQAFQLEMDKLKRYQEQHEHCTITAQQDGTVIYANDNSGWRGQQATQVEEGAQIKEFQTILRLPDLSKMQVKALVHETKVGRLRPGMPAVVKIRGLTTTGTITAIAPQAETSRSWGSSVKEYATYVQIDQRSGMGDLKPNMTAQVDILVRELKGDDGKGVVAIPIQCIVEKGRKFYAYVVVNGKAKGYEERPAVIGDSNDKYIEIKDGVSVGEEVILTPRAHCPEAREEVQGPDAMADLKALPAAGRPDGKKRKGGGPDGIPGVLPGAGGGPGEPSSGAPEGAPRAKGPWAGGVPPEGGEWQKGKLPRGASGNGDAAPANRPNRPQPPAGVGKPNVEGRPTAQTGGAAPRT